MVLECPQRPAGGPGGGAGADSRGDRVFHHCRRRPQGGSVRVVLHRRRHCLRRRAPGHDLGRHRCHGAGDGHPGQGAWPAIPAGRHRADRRVADHRRLGAAGRADALRVALGRDRLRQRAGDPDLHGAAARADRRHLACLCHDGGGPGHHLPVPVPHQGRAVAAGHHRGADRRSSIVLGLDIRTVGDMGDLARQPAGLPDSRHPAELRDAARSSSRIRSR